MYQPDLIVGSNERYPAPVRRPGRLPVASSGEPAQAAPVDSDGVDAAGRAGSCEGDPAAVGRPRHRAVIGPVATGDASTPAVAGQEIDVSAPQDCEQSTVG